MKNLIAIVVLALSFVSVGFGQTDTIKIDTVDYIRRVEEEFFRLLNHNRVEYDKVDTLYLQDDLKQFCEENNIRVLKNIEILSNTFETNRRFRQIAHEKQNSPSFNRFLDSIAKSLNLDGKDVPFNYEENASAKYIDFDKMSPIELGVKFYVGFMTSPDHRESLTNKLGISINLKLNYAKTIDYKSKFGDYTSNVFFMTVLIKLKDPNIK